jgi:phage tail sheath gpL-like
MAIVGKMTDKKSVDFDYLDVASSFLGAGGSILEGVGAYQAGKSEAAQRDMRAKQAVATGTRRAGEVRRQGDKVASDAVAANAFNGGAMDAGMIERMARIESDTDYNVLAEMYAAGTAAESEKYAAKVAKKTGQNRMIAGSMSAIPSILDGAQKIGWLE